MLGLDEGCTLGSLEAFVMAASMDVTWAGLWVRWKASWMAASMDVKWAVLKVVWKVDYLVDAMG